MSSEPLTPSRARLVELTPAECWVLLEQHAVGRLVWQVDGRPHVVPVNFTAHSGAVWFRTTPYGEIARACTHKLVAFEVDDLDPMARSGCSVVVVGTAEPQHRLPSELADLDTWVSGTRSLPVRIEPHEITGRRLVAV